MPTPTPGPVTGAKVKWLDNGQVFWSFAVASKAGANP
jgi:hypothetical protein